MNIQRVALLLTLLTGCSTTVDMPSLAMSHPAHPLAVDAGPAGPPSILNERPGAVARPQLPVAEPEHTAERQSPHDMQTANVTHTHQGRATTSITHPDPSDSLKAGDPNVVSACPIHPEVMGADGAQCHRCGLPLLPRIDSQGHGGMNTMAPSSEDEMDSEDVNRAENPQTRHEHHGVSP